MTYLALYRQWRPRLFKEIVGQRHITETLRNALVAGRVSHAYLFCGPRGTGKTSTAKILARSINCLSPHGGEPCNECRNCMQIFSGSTMDVIEIDAASNRGIDEIRELKENIKFYPSQGGKRIYIVDEVHMLTNEAFNALLKTLEEPPGHVVFVLATTEPHKVPLTILSRCQRFDFRPIPDQLIAGRLQDVAARSDYHLDEDALAVITRAAGGSLRDALSVMDQAMLLSERKAISADTVHNILGTVRESVLQGLAAGLANCRVAEVLKLVADAVAEGKDLQLLAGELTEYLRQLLVNMLAPEGIGDNILNGRETDPAGLFTPGRLTATIGLLVEAEREMRRSTHSRVLFEVALIRAMNNNGDNGFGSTLLPDGLTERVERLELAVRDLKARVTAGPEKGCAPVNMPDFGFSDQERLSCMENTIVKVNTVKEKQPFKDRQLPVSAGKISGIDKVKEPEAPDPDAGRDDAKVKNVSGLVGVEQIRKRWPDMLEALKKINPAAYTYLCQVWPAEVQGNCLVLGATEGDVFTRQMAEDPATKKLLAGILHSFTLGEWQIRCAYYDNPPVDWEQRKQDLNVEDAISLFNGKEIPLEYTDKKEEVK